MNQVNLVFQGGGVKGVAFAGVLDALENNPQVSGSVTVRGVGGVSVGAITAALYAAGYTARELDAELKKRPISSLLPERRPWTPVGAAWRLWRKKGLYSTSEIYAWINDLLGKKGVEVFRDLKRKPCRILAANVTEGKYAPYSDELTPEEHVASAVLRSLSIPFFSPRTRMDNGCSSTAAS